jgi:hypothetical protein
MQVSNKRTQITLNLRLNNENRFKIRLKRASGGIWTRDRHLTKVMPHQARLPRHYGFSLKRTCARK